MILELVCIRLMVEHRKKYIIKVVIQTLKNTKTHFSTRHIVLEHLSRLAYYYNRPIYRCMKSTEVEGYT